MQPEGRPAKQLKLPLGSTLEDLLIALNAQHGVEFQLPDRTYALFPRNTPLAELQQECSQDGHTEATALQFRTDQAQGLPFSSLLAVKAIPPPQVFTAKRVSFEESERLPSYLAPFTNYLRSSDRSAGTVDCVRAAPDLFVALVA